LDQLALPEKAKQKRNLVLMPFNNNYIE